MDIEEQIILKTTALQAKIQECIKDAYHLEALRAEIEEDNDSTATRLITMLKTARGITRTRLLGK